MHIRGLLAFLHDVAAAAVAWCVAFWLRFNLEVPPDYLKAMLAHLPYVLVVHVAVFWLLGLYRGLWRYASLPDLQRILLAVGLGALAVPALLILAGKGALVPRSVYVIAPLLLAGIMSGSRLAYRAWKEKRLIDVVAHPESSPVLVLGAGDAAVLLLKELAASHQWRVLGLLDDDPRKQGGEIERVKVLGTIERVAEIAERHGVTQAIIAMPGAAHEVRKRAVDMATAAGLSVMTVPALADIISGKVSVSALRNIELDDLLGRDPVELDIPGLQGFLKGKTVLVTGAGGSIGAELCRQIARFQPARVVLFELSELALYRIEQEFREANPGVEVVAAIGDAKDAARMNELFAQCKPAVVFHAAAYKHVPLMESDNALQAVQNNVLGTLAVARAAIAAGCGKFVLVSTDKAVNPSSVMGASKRLAELVCQALVSGSTQFVIVRFGNVLGLHRQRGAALPRADCARRPGHRHPSGHAALLHVHPGGGATGAAGGANGARGRNLRPRHGRGSENRRPGAADDPALGAGGVRDPDRVHGLEAGGEALRGAGWRTPSIRCRRRTPSCASRARGRPKRAGWWRRRRRGWGNRATTRMRFAPNSSHGYRNTCPGRRPDQLRP